MIGSYPLVHEGRAWTPDGPADVPEGESFACTVCQEIKPTYSGTSRLFPEYGLIRPAYPDPDASGSLLTACWDCMAELERQYMIETGRAILYISGNSVQSFTGKLRFGPLLDCVASDVYVPGAYSRVRRIDLHFIGPDGFIWWGRNQGDMDLVRCRRTKQRA